MCKPRRDGVRVPLAWLALAFLLCVGHPTPAAAQGQPIPSPLRAAPAQPSDITTTLTLDAASYAALSGAGQVTLTGFVLDRVTSVDLVLSPVEVYAPNATIELVTARGPIDIGPPDVVLLSGKVAGADRSFVYLALSPFGSNGYLEVDGQMFVLSSLPADGGMTSVIYNLTTLPEGAIAWSDWQCRVDELLEQPGMVGGAGPGLAAAPRRCVDVAIDTDFEYLSDLFFGDVNAANAYIATLVGAVSSIYQRDLNASLYIVFSRLWDTPSDPWTQSDSEDQLFEFKDYWLANMGYVVRNGAHMFSGRRLGGGVAWRGALCNPDFGFAFSGDMNGHFPIPLRDNDPQNWDPIVVAHEWGHNFGAKHTHEKNPPIDGCGSGDCTDASSGTLMSYCHLCPGEFANIALHFHPRNIDEDILPYLDNGAGCDLRCELDSYSQKVAFQLFTRGNTTPIVTMHHWTRAFAKSRRCRDRDRNNGSFPLPGVGQYIVYALASAPSSTGSAYAQVNLNTYGIGEATGGICAYGDTYADREGCSKKRGKGAKARAKSRSRVSALGVSYLHTIGVFTYNGNWVSSQNARGKAKAKISRDPVGIRLIDHTAGTVQAWTPGSIKTEVVDGRVGWQGNRLFGAGREYRLLVDVGAPIVAEAGQIEFRVESNLVTQLIATGMFAYLLDGDPTNGELPAIGSLGGFNVPMPGISLNYDLGADPTHNVDMEISLDNAGHGDDQGDELCADIRPDYLSDLGNGCAGEDTSTPHFGLSQLGFSVADGAHSLIDYCTTPGGSPIYLGELVWPVYQSGAPEDTDPPTAIYVRIWDGDPLQGGSVVAGDLSTDRLEDVYYPGVFRVTPTDPTDCSLRIAEVTADMTWAPPLDPAREYGFEVVVVGAPGFGQVHSPAAPFPQDPGLFRPAGQFSVQSGQWTTLVDNGMGVSIPFRLYGDAEPHPCDVDCDLDGSVDTRDFICFLNAFSSGADYADFDSNGEINTQDFIAYLGAWNEGCD